MTDYTYTMGQARDIIRHAIVNPLPNDQHRVCYLEGDPGIGKTALMYSLYEEFKRTPENPNGFTCFVPYVAPEREPTDWGLPMPNAARNAISMLPLEEFLYKDGDRPFIFLDEIDKANNMMQNVLGRVMHEKKVGNIVFPRNTFVAAAGNKLTNRAGGFSANTHIKNRRTHVPVRADAKEWIDAVGIPFDLHPAVVSYIRTDHEILHKFDATAPSFPSPRSWTKVGLELNRSMPQHVEDALIEGDIGIEARKTFTGHLKIFRSLRDPEKIIREPKGVDLPTGKDSVPIMYAEVTSLAKYANKTNADAIFTYFNRLPGEYGFVGYRDVMMRDKSLIGASKSGQAWMVKHATALKDTKA